MSDIRSKFKAKIFQIGDLEDHVWDGVALTHASDPEGDDPVLIPLPIEALRALGAHLLEEIEVEVIFHVPGSSDRFRSSAGMDTDARDFAAKAHAAQKYGEGPYTAHLDEVVAILKEYGHTSPVVLEAGFLHDVLEDTPTTQEYLCRNFGWAVAEIVSFCTDEKGVNRKTRKALTYARMAKQIVIFKAGPEVEIATGIGMSVKLADRIANLRQSHRANPGLLSMYRKEAAAFKTALFVSGHDDAMWAEYDRLVAGV